MIIKIIKKISISVFIFLILLFTLEHVLAMMYTFPNDYFTSKPNSSFQWEIDTSEFSGIYQNSFVSFNEIGARSVPIENKKNKIIAIGGSTTACLALNQSKTWTSILQKKLGKDSWVGNFGRSGNNSNDHVLQIDVLLDKSSLNNTKSVIILMGINDFAGYLVDSNKYINRTSYEISKSAFEYLPDELLPWYRQTTIFKLLRKSKKLIDTSTGMKTSANAKKRIQNLRQNAEFIKELPNLDNGLAHYEKNILRLIEIAKKKRVKLIFATQPVMWSDHLSELDENKLTMGYKNKELSIFYATDILSRECINLINGLLIFVDPKR